MTTTGTYNFNAPASDLVLEAFARLQIRRTAIGQEHLADAALSANLLLTEWASKQPLLWKSVTQDLGVLTQGVAQYTPNPNTVAVLIAYIRTGAGTSNQIDRVIGPLSTVEYQSMPAKTEQGAPTSFWFNRQIAPQILLWPTPDNGGPYNLIVQTVSQVQDVALGNAATLDVPYRYLDAFAAGLAHRLAQKYAQPLEAQRKADAMEAWNNAFGNDVESVPFYVLPQMGGYFR